MPKLLRLRWAATTDGAMTFSYSSGTARSASSKAWRRSRAHLVEGIVLS
ncbi:MAG: hypothetical protein ACP5VR_06050 [Acidimicrobiales bacterium]